MPPSKPTASSAATAKATTTTTARRNRNQLVCTECHRLKIKCDRCKPCSSCIKRGRAERCKTASTDGWLSNSKTNYQRRSSPPSQPATLPSPQSSPPSEYLPSHTSPQYEAASLNEPTIRDSLPIQDWSHGIPELLKRLESSCSTLQFQLISKFLGSPMHDSVFNPVFNKAGCTYNIISRDQLIARFNTDWSQQNLADVYCFTALLLGMHANIRASRPQLCRNHIFKVHSTEEIQKHAKITERLALECVDQAKQYGELRVDAIMAMLSVGSCRKESGDFGGYREMLARAIHEAQMLGMHLEPHNTTLSIEEVETRRNLWWCLFLYDRMTALNTDLPHLIGPYMTIKLPVLLLDGSIMPVDYDARSPEGIRANKCTVLHNIVMAQLAHISGRIYDQCHLSEFTPADALLLDKELQIFEHSLPSTYKFGSDGPDNQEPNTDESRQRYVLHMTCFNLRCFLFKDLEKRILLQGGPEWNERALKACKLSIVHSAMSLIQIYKTSLKNLSEDYSQWVIFIKPVCNAIGILLDAFLDDVPSSPSSHSWFYYKVAVEGQELLERISHPGSPAREALNELDDRIQRAARAIESS